VLALRHQPTRQHGRGFLFEPGIEQLRDLLAELGGMAQPRKFVTRQGITGRRQKELPGRLGFVIQGDLQGKKPVEVTIIVKTVKSTQLRTFCGISVHIVGLRSGAEKLHKPRGGSSVRPRGGPEGNSVRACSACCGDYEEPEETAWDGSSEEGAGEAEPENAEQPEACEGFPVRAE
jgi:hypothetical protein